MHGDQGTRQHEKTSKNREFLWKPGRLPQNQIPPLVGERKDDATTNCGAQGNFEKIIQQRYSQCSTPGSARQIGLFAKLSPAVDKCEVANSSPNEPSVAREKNFRFTN
jgi:hypothetical protein